MIMQLKERAKETLAYDFKFGPEALWFVTVAVVVSLMIHLADFEPHSITDWHAWAIGIVAAMIRALAGAMLYVLIGPKANTRTDTQ
jgi:hypothetical protein